MNDKPSGKTASRKRSAIRVGEPVFGRFPDAVVADGLVFTSGTRAAEGSAGFDALPPEGRSKQQGFAVVDEQEGWVSSDSWGAHAHLESVLAAAGSSNAQILRQHIWQKDKRFFPCYETIRMHWQPTPAPSSGVGVKEVPGRGNRWIGIDAIGVVPGHPLFTERAVVSAVDQAELPSASHYSQAVRSGPFVFTAGHIPIMTATKGKPVIQSFDDIPEEGRFLATGRSHPDSRDGPIAAQTWAVYKELELLLARAKLTLKDVVLSTVYLADLRELAVFHRVHRHFFPKDGPALAVSGFDEIGHRGCLIEIELTALDPAYKLERKSIDWSIPAPFAAPAAVKAGPFTFFSGICGLDASGRFRGEIDKAGKTFVDRVAKDDRSRKVAAEAWLAMSRLGENIAAAGGGLQDLVKVSAYLGKASDFELVNAVAEELLPGDALPAFECVVVSGPGPAPEASVQLEAIGNV